MSQAPPLPSHVGGSFCQFQFGFCKVPLSNGSDSEVVGVSVSGGIRSLSCGSQLPKPSRTISEKQNRESVRMLRLSPSKMVRFSTFNLFLLYRGKLVSSSPFGITYYIR